jgi:tetratricopeptide (TPR) repeat protein
MEDADRTRRSADIAYHFLQATEPARALPYVLRAGEQAMAVYAHPEAERHYRTALELARQLGDPISESMAADHLGHALTNQIRYDEAFTVLERAAAEAERRGDLARLTRLTNQLSRLDIERGALDEGVSRLVRLIKMIEPGEANSDLFDLYLNLAHTYYGSGQYAEELATAERALQVAQALGDAAGEARARERHGAALSLLGRLEEALLELKTAVQALDDFQDLLVLVLALSNLGSVLTYLGRIGEAQSCFERGLAVAKVRGAPDWVAWQMANCGLNAFARGDWAVARSYIERAVALRPQIDASFWASAYLYEFEVSLQLVEGQLEVGCRSAERGLALAKRSGDLQRIRAAQRLRAELDLLLDNPAGARDRLLPLLDRVGLIETDVNQLLPHLARAQLELGEVEAAEALAKQTMERVRSQHDRLTLLEALGVEAAVCIRQERWDEAEAALDEALALARSMPYPYAEAKLLATYGDMLVAHGQLEQARGQYAAALAILLPLGEVPYTERIERAMAEMNRR